MECNENIRQALNKSLVRYAILMFLQSKEVNLNRKVNYRSSYIIHHNKVLNLQTKTTYIHRDIVVDEHANSNRDKEKIEKENAGFQNLNLLPVTQSFGSESMEEDEESRGILT